MSLSFRVSPATRGHLVEIAKDQGRDFTEVARTMIEEAIEGEIHPPPMHLAALGRAVASLAARIEARTGKRWNYDADSSKALHAGMKVLLDHIAKRVDQGEPTEGTIDAVHERVRDRYKTPEGTGENEADILIALIETVPSAAMAKFSSYTPDDAGVLALVRALNIMRTRDRVDAQLTRRRK